MINNFKDYENLFMEINKLAKIKLNIYLIGGAVLLYRNLKFSTKDIDVVLISNKEYNELYRILKKLNFKQGVKKIGYKNFNLTNILKKDKLKIDIFLNEVCSKFSFSNEMVKRAEKILNFDKVKVYLSSNEDVFAFKTMTNREGDLEDCVALAKRKLDWDIILKEIKNQINLSGENIWITWINERLELLIEKGVVVPIIKETNKLTIAYYNKI
jgi:hypothetical protein